jgi:hypothetical protein
MLFVSRFSNLIIVIRKELTSRGENELGQRLEWIERPPLIAQFQPLRLTEAQRIIAVRMFTAINPASPWGSVAYPVEGVMGQEFGDLIMDTEMYSGYNPAFNLAKFDTRADISYEQQKAHTEQEQADLKKLVEETLLGTDSINKDYVRLDEALPKPWPNYPMETGPGVAKKIAAQARDFGIPFQEIVDFEKTQDKPREYVIAELDLELAKIKASEAERAALGAVIS